MDKKLFPKYWCIGCVISFVMGICLIMLDFKFKIEWEWIKFHSIFPRVPADKWLGFLGLNLSIVAASSLLIHFSQNCLSNLFKIQRIQPNKDESEEGRVIYPPIIVGSLEMILYIGSLFVEKPEFIAVWLALKVAGQWKSWEDSGPPGRARFQLFLIGNALSVICANIGYRLLRSYIS